MYHGVYVCGSFSLSAPQSAPRHTFCTGSSHSFCVMRMSLRSFQLETDSCFLSRRSTTTAAPNMTVARML